MNFNADIVVGQTFPDTVMLLLDQNLTPLAQEARTEQAAMFLIELEKPFATRLLNFLFDLTTHTGRSRTLTRREAKNVHFGKLQFQCKLIGSLKIFVALAGETGDDIGTDGNTRH